MIEHHGVNIPICPDGWQLYDMPGANRAARSLARHALDACDLIRNAKACDVAEAVNQAVLKLRKRCDHYAELGAADTEPRGVASRIIEQTADACGFKCTVWV